MKFILDVLPAVGLVAGVILLLLVSIDQYLGLPVVQITYPGEQCVEVKYSTDHSCDNLPRKYIIEWVGEINEK